MRRVNPSPGENTMTRLHASNRRTHAPADPQWSTLRTLLTELLAHRARAS
jgi:hypothetical protein